MRFLSSYSVFTLTKSAILQGFSLSLTNARVVINGETGGSRSLDGGKTDNFGFYKSIMRATR